MKKSLSIIASLLVLNLTASCQNKISLLIFSEGGESFYTYINGIKQNETAQANVSITDLSPYLSLRIEFENKTLPALKQLMALEPGREHTLRIALNTKKQLSLRYFGSRSLDEYANNTKEYNTAEDTGTDLPSVALASRYPKNPGASYPRSSGNKYSSDHKARHYTTSNNCHPSTTRSAMSQADFNRMKQSIASKTFSDSKISTARLATKNALLSVTQIMEVIGLFSFDNDRLAYAKFAYDYCADKANYYQVGNAFTFSTTADELNAFLMR